MRVGEDCRCACLVGGGGGGVGQPKLPWGKDVTDHNGEGGERGWGHRSKGSGGLIPMQVDNMYTGWRAEESGGRGLSA